jgi:hypothetical protein
MVQMAQQISSPPRRGRNEYTLFLTADVLSIRLPRKMVEWALENWGLAHVAEKAALVMSELSTNVVNETPGRAFWTRATLREDGIFLEVWDQSPRLPPECPELPDSADEGGRGLYVIAALSLKYGVEEHPPAQGGGKIVWALISREQEHEEAAA